MDKNIDLTGSRMARTNRMLAMVSAFLNLVVVGLIVYGVIARYVFRSPTMYSVEVPGLLFIVIVAFALPYTQMRGHHVRVDVLTSRLKGKLKRAFHIIASVATLAYCAVVAWALALKFAKDLASGAWAPDSGLPLAPFSLAIVIGISLMALQIVIEETGPLTKRGHNKQG
jgi:TRAP-type C4-dicarboxylate transport system permease small subunit